LSGRFTICSEPLRKEGVDQKVRTTVKICGLRDADTVRSILHLPIDYIGFVFAESRRKIAPAQARECIRPLGAEADHRPAPKTVGVFVNPDLEEIRDVMAQAPLDVIQLHGRESAEFCRTVRSAFGVQIFKTVTVDPAALHNMDTVAAQLDSYRGAIDAVLLDTFDPHAAGGTGKTFAWECIPIYKEWTRLHGIQLLVAGGLNPGNVGELIAAYRPDGVDVSSGVETGGIKDVKKISLFVERVGN